MLVTGCSPGWWVGWLCERVSKAVSTWWHDRGSMWRVTDHARRHATQVVGTRRGDSLNVRRASSQVTVNECCSMPCSYWTTTTRHTLFDGLQHTAHNTHNTHNMNKAKATAGQGGTTHGCTHTPSTSTRTDCTQPPSTRARVWHSLVYLFWRTVRRYIARLEP